MTRKRTFIDSGVLIAAARGDDAPSAAALEILDDQSREFASSPFIKRHASETINIYGINGLNG